MLKPRFSAKVELSSPSGVSLMVKPADASAVLKLAPFFSSPGTSTSPATINADLVAYYILAKN